MSSTTDTSVLPPYLPLDDPEPPRARHRADVDTDLLAIQDRTPTGPVPLVMPPQRREDSRLLVMGVDLAPGSMRVERNGEYTVTVARAEGYRLPGWYLCTTDNAEPVPLHWDGGRWSMPLTLTIGTPTVLERLIPESEMNSLHVSA